MEIRKLTEAEKPAALELAWRVFQIFEAPEYAPEGVETFRAYVQDPSTAKHLTVYGALEGETMVGVLALRTGERHISLFFVDAAWHRRGVGRALFQALLGDTGGAPLTVNSSPYAVEIYRHLGFQATDTEQVRDGIRYTPMQFDGSREADI